MSSQPILISKNNRERKGIIINNCSVIFQTGIKADEDYGRQDFIADCGDIGIKARTAAAYWLKVGGTRHGAYNWKERRQA
ncbi:MAG: hypothetical protein GY861_24285 [bacterium]|nr:hypothetical protein [bacterium]